MLVARFSQLRLIHALIGNSEHGVCPGGVFICFFPWRSDECQFTPWGASGENPPEGETRADSNQPQVARPTSTHRPALPRLGEKTGLCLLVFPCTALASTSPSQNELCGNEKEGNTLIKLGSECSWWSLLSRDFPRVRGSVAVAVNRQLRPLLFTQALCNAFPSLMSISHLSPCLRAFCQRLLMGFPELN